MRIGAAGREYALMVLLGQASAQEFRLVVGNGTRPEDDDPALQAPYTTLTTSGTTVTEVEPGIYELAAYVLYLGGFALAPIVREYGIVTADGTPIARRLLDMPIALGYGQPQYFRPRLSIVGGGFGGAGAGAWSATYAAWDWRAPITVTNPPAVRDYAVRVVVPKVTGMDQNCVDLRFATNGGVALPYWIETITVNDAVAWVQVANGTTTFWAYWGNTGATSESDGTGVFLYFIDFETGSIDAGWYMTGLESATVVDVGGVWYLSTTGGAGTFGLWSGACGYRDLAFPTDFEAVTHVGVNSVANSLGEHYLYLQGTNAEITAGIADAWATGDPEFAASIDGTAYGSGMSSRNPNYACSVAIRRVGGTATVYENGVERLSAASDDALTKLCLAHTRYTGFAGHTALWDYVYVRPAQDPEPSCAVGTAEAKP